MKTLLIALKNNILKVLKNKSMMFWGLSMLANVLIWLYTLALGRVLSVAQLGILATLVSIQNILSTPAASIGGMIGRYIPHFQTKSTTKELSNFYHHYLSIMFFVGLGISISIVLFENLIENTFHINSTFLIIIFSPISLLVYLNYFQRGIMSGHLSFHYLGILSLVESGVKLALILGAIYWPYSKLNFAVLAWVISLFCMLLVGHWLIRRRLSVKYHKPSRESLVLLGQFSEYWWYVANSLTSRAVIILLMSLDVLLIRFYLPEQSGVYALLSIVGKAILFLGTSLQSLIGPKVSHQVANKQNPLPRFLRIISIIFALSSGMYLLLLVFPAQLGGILVGEKARLITTYFGVYGLGVLAWVVAICFQSFAMAVKNFNSQKIFTLTIIMQALGIYFFHQNLSQAINVLSFTYVFCAILVVFDTLSSFYKTNNFLAKNI